MPAKLQIINRYRRFRYVVGAAVFFDQEAISAATKRSATYGIVDVPTEHLADGAHVMHVLPVNTSTDSVGPTMAENVGPAVTEVFRSLDINITIKKGRIVSASVSADQEPNGEVGVSENPRVIKLQPVYYRSQHQTPNSRTADATTMIVVHQTAGSADIGGTLDYMREPATKGSAHYVLSAEAKPRVVKVVQETGISWHVGEHSWWRGQTKLNNISIGIEMSHQKGTPWPAQQIPALVDFLEVLLKAHPEVPRQNIVGHMDVYTTGQGVLVGRECPGMEFDWPTLEKAGLGLIPKSGSISLDGAYGGFFRAASGGRLLPGDRDSTRVWGGKTWKSLPEEQSAAAAKVGKDFTKAAGKVVGKTIGGVVGNVVGAMAGAHAETVNGEPIKELQTDLREIGYSVDVTGIFDTKTVMAVQMFQQHFFAGSRRNLIVRGRHVFVDGTTAEFVKRVRP